MPSLPLQAKEELETFVRGGVDNLTLDTLFFALSGWCMESERPVILIIDEVDSATNNQAFLDFLAQLRQQYLARRKRLPYPAFQSVVLAGVTDVRHLKARICPDVDARPNSPWNIAADFDVVMSFDEADVAGMLVDYEADHVTGMDVDAVAGEVVAWTGGYPFLVSRICQLMDVSGLPRDRTGVNEAVRLPLAEGNALFGSLVGKLEAYPDLKNISRALSRGPYLWKAGASPAIRIRMRFSSLRCTDSRGSPPGGSRSPTASSRCVFTTCSSLTRSLPAACCPMRAIWVDAASCATVGCTCARFWRGKRLRARGPSLGSWETTWTAGPGRVLDFVGWTRE